MSHVDTSVRLSNEGVHDVESPQYRHFCTLLRSVSSVSLPAFLII